MTVVRRMTDPLAPRLAGLSYIALGLGFGIGGVVAFPYLARNGELPMTPWGFRAFEGPATGLGTGSVLALGATLTAVCALDVVAGTWLWQGRRRGARLGLATTIPAMTLGTAFALPLLLVGVPIRVALVVLARDQLRR
jgi:hypothetical protein